MQFTVNPPSTWGGITGTVSGRACNGTTAPLPGATVQVTSAHGSWVLGTDAGGQYSLWLDTTNNPLTVIVSATGWKSQAVTVTLTKQSTTTRNFTLTPTASCT